MQFIIKTQIDKNYQLIFSKFDVNLFIALKPPFMNLNVLRFDGCKRGDEIHLEMNVFGKFNQKWIGHVSDDFRDENCIYFVDEGALLPFPLKKWKHVHRIDKINEHASYIIDDIKYSTDSDLVDLVIYPFLYIIFSLRVPVYKKIFYS